MIAPTSATWPTRRLGDFFKIKHGYAFKGQFFAEDGPYIVLTPGNFYDEGGFKLKSKEKYYIGDVPEGFILRKDDLIVAMTEQAEGLLGSSAVIPKDDCYLHNQRLGLITDLNAEELDLCYLYYLFNSRIVRAQIRATANGAKVRHTSPSRIYEVEFPHPPLETQRKIASILSAYDDLIENNTRRINILEEMVQAIYREWFVNFRFPGHEKVRMVDSPLGRVPEGWEVVKLVEVAAVNAWSVRKGNAPDTINYIDISSVSTGSIDKVEEFAFTDAPSRARRIVQNGDAIWATVRPNRKSYCLILKPIDDLIVSTGFAVLSPIQVPYTYLYLATTTDEFADYLVNNATGSAYPAVNAGDFKNADILLPSGEILDCFHIYVEDLLLLRHDLELKNKNLRQTRDLLLPKLISGVIDISPNQDLSGDMEYSSNTG